MKLEAGYKQGIYSVIIDKAAIQKGEFEGFIAVDYNKRQKRSNGKILVSKIAFSPEIQELMWGGQFAPFAITGSLNLDEKFRIDNARMNLGFKSFEAKGLSAANGNLLVEWTEGAARIAVGAANLKLSRESEYSWFFATLLDAGLNKDVLSFSKLHADGRAEGSKLLFDRIVGTAAVPRAELTAEYKAGNSQGTWAWQGTPTPYEWKWFYRNRQLMLIPQTAAMKDWLKLNDHFMDEFRFIHLENPEI